MTKKKMQSVARYAPSWFNSARFVTSAQSVQKIQGKYCLWLVGERITVKLIQFSSDSIHWWIIEWEIVQTHQINTGSSGRIQTGDNVLREMFGIKDDPNLNDHDDIVYISQTRATRGKIGTFVRKHNYLNVPFVGSGFDDDPNVSIFITPEIQKQVKRLLRGKCDQ